MSLKKRKRRSCLAIIACISWSLPVSGFDNLFPLLKQPNPDELAFSILIDGSCPLHRDAVSETVEGVLIRSRIKPLSWTAWVDRKPYLSVRLNCMASWDSRLVYNVEVFFGDATGTFPVIYDANFGSLGIGKPEGILNAVKANVERAMVIYVRANFNL